MSPPQPLSVRLDESDDAVATTHRSVLAGLPNRWRIGEAATDAAVVFGGRLDWPSRAGEALASGARGVLITRPVCTSPAEVAELARYAAASGAHAVVESSFLADPAWKRVLPVLRERAAEAVLVDSLRLTPKAQTLRTEDLNPHCLEQLAVARTVLGQLSTASFRQRTDEHYMLTFESSDRIVNLVGVRGGPGSDQLTIELVSLACRWRVIFHDGAIAQPTTVEMTDGAGRHAASEIFETGRRGSWIELHQAITDDGHLSYDLDILGECLRLIASSAGEPTSTTPEQGE
jgi:hypothetical protein